MDPLKVEIPNNFTNDTAEPDFIPTLEALHEPFQTILEVLYSFTALTAFIFNIISVLFLVLSKGSSIELRKYLINLAISDLLISIFSIPFSYTDFMYGQWIFPLPLCPITCFIQITTVCSSIYTLVAIGFERYFAIIYPLESGRFVEKSTSIAIVSVWIFGITIAAPQLIVTRAVKFHYHDKELYDCRELWEKQIGGKIYSVIIFITTFVLPFGLLMILYITIGFKTFMNITPGNSNSERAEQQLRTKQKIVKMLVILVISFAICWFPIQIFNLLFWIFDDLREMKTPAEYYIYVGSYFVCHWLSMVHSSINPFIYCFLTSNFKIKEIQNSIGKPFIRLHRRMRAERPSRRRHRDTFELTLPVEISSNVSSKSLTPLNHQLLQ